MATNTQITDFCVGDEITIDHDVTGLPALLASAMFGLNGKNGLVTITITTAPTAQGVILDPGTLQPDNTYTAEVIFVLSGGVNGFTNTNLYPGVDQDAYINCLDADGGGPYTAELITFTPKTGGEFG